MAGTSYKRRRFSPDIIRHAVWLHSRFTLSLRDVEEMFAHIACRRPLKRALSVLERCWRRNSATVLDRGARLLY